MRDLVGVPKGCLFRKQVICERISLTQLVCLDAAFGPYLREMTVIRQVLCNTYATVSSWPNPCCERGLDPCHNLPLSVVLCM